MTYCLKYPQGKSRRIVTRSFKIKRLSWQTLSLLLFACAAALSQNQVPHLDQPTVPAVVTPGSGAFTLVVNGTGFAPGAILEWNGVAQATTFISPSQLSALVPAANVAVAGTATLTVVNSGSTIASNAIYFPVTTPSSSVFYAHASGSPINLGLAGGLPVEPMSITTGDVNGDGKPDLVFGVESTAGGPKLRVLFGKGDGTFQTGPTSNGVGSCPCSLALGDLNGDGELDLAVTAANDNTLSILLGAGDGSFSAMPTSPLNVGDDPTSVVMADFNRDSKLDLAVANDLDDTITILLGHGDGTFSAAGTLSAPAGPFSLAVGDFNADGKLDIAASNTTGNFLTVLLGVGDGTFGGPSTVPSKGGFALSTGDFNGDGKLDIAASNQQDSTVSILLGNGDGTFTEVPGCCGISTELTLTFDMRSGDFNGDGKLDLALSILDSKPLLPVSYVVMLLGNGDGTFTATNFTLLLPVETAVMTAGDFNGDGKLDFATGSNPDGDISVLMQPPVPAPDPDFAITTPTPTATITAGETASFRLQASSLNGFLGQLSLSCSGAPRQATCSLPSTAFLFDSATATFTASVSTRARTSSLMSSVNVLPTSGLPTRFVTAIMGSMLTLMFVLPGAKFSRTRRIGLACMVLTGAVFVTSCGGGAANPSSNGTPPGTYILTVTAGTGVSQKTTSLTLTVQ